MSGRFYLTATTGTLSDLFTLGDGRDVSGRAVAKPPHDLTPRYNIAPGQEIAIVRCAPFAAVNANISAEKPRRELAMSIWGLIPEWAAAADIGVRVTSCPIETADTVPALRASFQSRRCLIPADGIFEWARSAAGDRKPMLIRLLGLANRAAPCTFGIAALFDRWQAKESSTAIESCTMLTVPSNGKVRPFCERMPAVIRTQDYSAWLGEGAELSLADARSIKDLCRAWPDELTSVTPVGPSVNSPRFDDPRCLEPISGTPVVDLT